MAAENAPQGQPSATEGAVLADGLLGILRAGGRETAGGRREGRDTGAIESNQRQHEPLKAMGNQSAKGSEHMALTS